MIDCIKCCCKSKSMYLVAFQICLLAYKDEVKIFEGALHTGCLYERSTASERVDSRLEATHSRQEKQTEH